MLRTHYDNLQISQTASDTVIRAAYRALSQAHHPDKNPSNREEAERVMKAINEAYAVLSDPVRRKEHNVWISQQLHEAPDVQRPSHEPEPRSYSSVIPDERAPESPAQPAVVQDSLARIAGKGAIATAVGLVALTLLGLLSGKQDIQAITSFLITTALLALTIGPSVLLYAGFAALRKKTCTEGFGSWAKPLRDYALGAAVVTTGIYLVLEWVNRLSR